MELPYDDYQGYRACHTLKPEYDAECGVDLFILSNYIKLVRDYPNHHCENYKAILEFKGEIISDNYLVDLCNECLNYDNTHALEVLIKEIIKRNSDRPDGDKILFYRERKNENEYIFIPPRQKHPLTDKIEREKKKSEALKDVVNKMSITLKQLEDILNN